MVMTGGSWAFSWAHVFSVSDVTDFNTFMDT